MLHRGMAVGLSFCLAFSSLALAPRAHAQTPAAGPSSGRSGHKTVPTAFVVKFKVKPGKNAAFERAFAEMRKGVRAHEPGNVYYDLYTMDQDPQTYVVIEHYKDAAAVRAHGRTAHAKKLMADIADLLEGRPDAMPLDLVDLSP